MKNKKTSQYQEQKSYRPCIEDNLVVGVDLSEDGSCLTVARLINGNEIKFIKMFRDDEAYDVYKNLVGDN